MHATTWMNFENILLSEISHTQKDKYWDFPGGAVVGNPPASAGDTGSIPDPEGSHMPQSN